MSFGSCYHMHVSVGLMAKKGQVLERGVKSFSVDDSRGLLCMRSGYKYSWSLSHSCLGISELTSPLESSPFSQSLFLSLFWVLVPDSHYYQMKEAPSNAEFLIAISTVKEIEHNI